MPRLGLRDDDESGAAHAHRLMGNALLARWIATVGVDPVLWRIAAAALADDVWTPGAADLGPPDATFRRRGSTIDASFRNEIVGYSLVGAGATLTLPAAWPMTVTGALSGRALADVVSTPITRDIDATITAARRLGRGESATTVVIAYADVVDLGL